MTLQALTPHQSQYIAWLLTRRAAGDSVESLASTLVDAQIDLNPHQVDAALFACRNPLSRGVILADELDEDYKSLDETAEEFGERSNGQAGFRRAEPRRARYHFEQGCTGLKRVFCISDQTILTKKESMMSKNDIAVAGKTFEELKQINAHGAEYWSARDLQPLLGYSQWRRFEQAIDRAISSCKQSGNPPEHHFAGAGKPITGGKGAVQLVGDYHLSRFACYLIAQNGDPRKPEIAQAQKYFAIQTRRQELSDQAAADLERLELRRQTAEEFKALSGAAQEAGVQSRMFGVFHDAGYKGLYGGLGRDAIKRRKAIPEKDNLLDRMNTTELAANQFRMTQTRDKLVRDGIRNQSQAIQTHQQVGQEVRSAIQRIGGILPENIPADEPIKQVEKRLKSSTPKLELDDKDATGLSGGKTQES